MKMYGGNDGVAPCNHHANCYMNASGRLHSMAVILAVTNG
jgi:hypothetical protein